MSNKDICSHMFLLLVCHTTTTFHSKLRNASDLETYSGMGIQPQEKYFHKNEYLLIETLFSYISCRKYRFPTVFDRSCRAIISLTEKKR